MMPSHAPILIVEDDAAIREDLSELLRDEGYDVLTACNGAQGLDVLHLLRSCGQRPCLVLLDLMMPVMDGWAMVREMIEDPTLRDLPVFVVSGAANVSSEATALGAAGYLPKPFRWDALIGVLRQHC
jgi:CheY-like chemotaxis protein